MSILAELKRFIVIMVVIVCAIVAWLLIVIPATIFPVFKLPEWSVTLATALVLIGFPVVLNLARISTESLLHCFFFAGKRICVVSEG